jgi:hypothetical protein
MAGGRILLAISLTVGGMVGCGRLGFDGQASDGGLADASLGGADAARAIDAAGGELPAGLVAWYPFDDDPGDGVLDATGHGHDGACATCPTQAAGPVGGAFDFAEAPFIRVVHQAALDGSSGFTATAWIRVRSAPAVASCVLSKHWGSNFDTWNLCLLSDLAPVVCAADGADDECYFGASAPVPADTWVHVAVSHDQTTFRCYVDGALHFSWAQPLLEVGGDLTFGATLAAAGAQFEFDGLIDDVKLWDRVLTDDELLALATP